MPDKDRPACIVVKEIEQNDRLEEQVDEYATHRQPLDALARPPKLDVCSKERSFSENDVLTMGAGTLVARGCDLFN